MSIQDVPGDLDSPLPRLSFLDTLADELARTACSVFGSPVERDGVTVIPVATGRWLMGGGVGPHRSPTDRPSPEGAVGGGGGAVVKPIGFIEMARGRTRFRSIREPARPALAAAVVAAAATGLFGGPALRAIRRLRGRRVRARLRISRRGRLLRRLFR